MIYLDYNATTPTDPRVLEAMLPYFTEHFGNPSSAGHAWGWAASAAVEQARRQVATLIGASSQEVVFTSGATEAANLAIRGVAARYAEKGRHLVTCKTEHHAVLDPHVRLEGEGFEVTYLDVDAQGRVAPDELARALRSDTILVSLMRANNETGVVHPTEAFYDVCKAHDVLLFVDATQGPGKVPLSAQYADLMALSAHKCYGPKGVGALYVRRREPRVSLEPLVEGGGQERGLRAGTLNTPGIVGMGAAAALVHEYTDETSALRARRDAFEKSVRDALGDSVRVNGGETDRVPNTSSLTIPGVSTERLMASARTLAFSGGSACTSAAAQPSHVLRAMGLSDEDARSTVRVSIGRFTTDAEVAEAARAFVEAVQHEKALLAR